jgi:hypothetical protein
MEKKEPINVGSLFVAQIFLCGFGYGYFKLKKYWQGVVSIVVFITAIILMITVDEELFKNLFTIFGILTLIDVTRLAIKHNKSLEGK